MTRFFLASAAAIVVLALGQIRPGAQQPPARVAVGASSDWVVEGAGREADVKTAAFLGRDALWLRNGTHAIKSGVRLTDGTIELDVAPMDHGDFVAIVFRRESLANHENIYIRPSRSGEFMAIQYAPRTNASSTWQLYPQFTAEVVWPRNQWTHVRVEVQGSALEVFVGNAQKPTLSVARLRHVSANGDVGFWARVNNQPTEWAAAISNVLIRPAANTTSRIDTPAVEAGRIAAWEAAGPVVARQAVVEALPANLEWKPASAEEAGLVNLNRLFPARPQLGRQTAFLRTTIDATSPRRQLAGIGYSDDVTVFVNGEPGTRGRMDGRAGRLDSSASSTRASSVCGCCCVPA